MGAKVLFPAIQSPPQTTRMVGILETHLEVSVALPPFDARYAKISREHGNARVYRPGGRTRPVANGVDLRFGFPIYGKGLGYRRGHARARAPQRLRHAVPDRPTPSQGVASEGFPERTGH